MVRSRILAGAPGAIAVIALTSDTPEALDDALRRLAGVSPAPGRVTLRDLASIDRAPIDRGVVVRWTPTLAHLMPHAGPAVLRALAQALESMGVAPWTDADAPDPRALWPEARTDLEARVLDALSRGPSPLGVDLLLAQPSRWAAHERGGPGPDPALDAARRPLLDPPLVVALGPSNVGKSTLLNALAGRAVAAVADEPGTTRDPVGVTLDLGGLVVRCLDTPGLRPRHAMHPAEREALDAGLELARRADLLLLLGDAGSPAPDPASLGLAPPARVRAALRADLGPAPWACDVSVCAPRAEGLDDLVRRVRATLVPDAALSDPRPWRFWDRPSPQPPAPRA